MKLAAHGWALELLPALGGAIGALRYDGQDVLRPLPDGSADVLATACFPLVPYANRIAGGRFDFAGREHRVPLNFGDHPHSLHGLGWQAEWNVAASDAESVTLVHAHDGGAGWRWAYHAEQRIRLAPGQLQLELALTNRADEAMPAGLGFHPYFSLAAETRLQFDTARAWLADATMLPTMAAPADHFGDWAVGAQVAGPTLIDNAYEGWSGTARIDQPWGTITLKAEGASVLHLYRPPGEPFFCVEPVSHLPDAINRDGMAVLDPGATQTLVMTLSI